MRHRDVTEYELKQVRQFIADLHSTMGGNIDWEDWEGEALIAYFELRRQCCGAVYKYCDWGQIYCIFRDVMARLKQIESDRVRLESRLSLNATYGESGQQVVDWLPQKNGDFVNRLALWDYMERLGELKFQILRLLYRREEDYEIICRLHLTKEEYYRVKMEIRADFLRYLEMGK